jgi:hypothetical protein
VPEIAKMFRLALHEDSISLVGRFWEQMAQ